jgi:hypothetical protein
MEVEGILLSHLHLFQRCSLHSEISCFTMIYTYFKKQCVCVSVSLFLFHKSLLATEAVRHRTCHVCVRACVHVHTIETCDMLKLAFEEQAVIKTDLLNQFFQVLKWSIISSQC